MGVYFKILTFFLIGTVILLCRKNTRDRNVERISLLYYLVLIALLLQSLQLYIDYSFLSDCYMISSLRHSSDKEGDGVVLECCKISNNRVTLFCICIYI